LNKLSRSRRHHCFYQVHMSLAWYWNQDLQWHDSNVRRCQWDKQLIEDSDKNLANYSAERNKKQERDYTSFKNHFKSTEFFCLWRLNIEVNQVIEFTLVWKFIAECK